MDRIALNNIRKEYSAFILDEGQLPRERGLYYGLYRSQRIGEDHYRQTFKSQSLKRGRGALPRRPPGRQRLPSGYRHRSRRILFPEGLVD